VADDDRGARPFLRPIDRCWVATGPYGAPNYDEFASCDEVRIAAAARPESIIAVDNPQCFGGLAQARAELRRMQDDGRYARHDGAVLLYDLGGVRALVGLVGTDEISSAPGEPGRLLRNEEVFADKVVERQAHLEALRTLVSPVLLVPDRPGLPVPQGFPDTPPLVEEIDEQGLRHRLWLLDDPGEALAALAERTYFVADGNHRSLAAQQAGFGVCLAVIADPAALTIEPYHRLLELRMSGAELVDRAGALHPVAVARRDPDRTHLYADGQLYRLDLPELGGPVERLPHTVVERLLIQRELGLDPASVTYVGGTDVGPLTARVDAGATAALLMRPVTAAEFAAVNAARLPMPRKSTWFTPKARSGLVLAEV
jgi:uncharacterized protein (DUF1015 family)